MTDTEATFGFVDLGGWDVIGQVTEELLDHFQVFAVEVPIVPGLRGIRQL